VDFGWTEEQQRLRDRVIEFARAELADDGLRRDADGEFSAEAWRACAELGIQGLPVPRRYGGGEVDPLTFTMAMEALGYGCADNGLLFALGAQICSVEAPLLRFGTEEQKDRYLPGLCNGSIVGAHGMTEPGSGSDAFSLATTAERRGDHYVLNGRKWLVTAGPVADVVVVFAKTAPAGGFAGVSVFLVERSTPGLLIGPPLRKMGLRTVPMSEVTLEDCAVPEDRMLGSAGAGFAVFNHSMEWERSHIFAGPVGVMQRQVERAIAYALERRQFGQPIGKFQAVSHRIVDIELRVRTSRLLLYELAWLRSQGRSAPLESAVAKLWVSEAFLASSLDALFVHGGLGYLAETGLERDVRDAVGGCIYSGTSDMQRNIIAARLGL
jgi:alkylation response protein AidB-like acyl-CoA dehydrogenase